MRFYYIIAYDISSTKIRTKVAKFLLNHGTRVQYSVFCCRLTPKELIKLKNNLNKLIQPEEEASVLIIKSGPVVDDMSTPDVEWLGREWVDNTAENII